MNSLYFFSYLRLKKHTRLDFVNSFFKKINCLRFTFVIVYSHEKTIPYQKQYRVDPRAQQGSRDGSPGGVYSGGYTTRSYRSSGSTDYICQQWREGCIWLDIR
jgi:hypothetical protein